MSTCHGLALYAQLNRRYASKLKQPSVTITRVHSFAPYLRYLRCVRYAMRTISRVLPARGSESVHVHPPPGLRFQQFAAAGVICAMLLESSLILFLIVSVTSLIGFVGARHAP